MTTGHLSGHSKAFIPISYIACSTIVLFIAGLAGVLRAGVWAAGILAAAFLITPVIMAVKGKIEYKSFIPGTTLIFFIGTVIWLFLATRDAAVIHTDDFSHWYKICKIMHCESAFPTTPDLAFPSYTPGTAVWIYFITSLMGFSADNCFFAQGLINICALTSLFSLTDKMVGKTKIFAQLFLTTSAITLCSVTENTYVLLVDVPLGLTACAAFILILSDTKRDTRFAVTLASLLTLVMLIKASGALFVIAGIALLFITGRKSSLKTCITATAITAACAIALPALYLARSKKYYGDLANTQQGLSTARFLSLYSSKSPENIKDTVVFYLKSIFMTGMPSTQIIVIWIALFGLFVILMVSKHNKTVLYKENKLVLIFSLVLLFIFWGALLATYLFSMEVREANGEFLASFNRYNGTIAIIVLGMLARQVTRNTEKMKNVSAHPAVFITSAVTVFAVGIIFFNFTYLLGCRNYECDEAYYTAGPWDVCMKYIPEINEYNECRYMVVYDESVFEDDFRNKLEWMMVVHLRSIHMRFVGMDEFINGEVSEDDWDYIGRCDYIVAFGDGQFEELLKTYISPDTHVYLNDL